MMFVDYPLNALASIFGNPSQWQRTYTANSKVDTSMQTRCKSMAAHMTKQIADDCE